MSRLFVLLIVTAMFFWSCNTVSEKHEASERRIITFENTPASRPYSPAVEAGNMLFVSGQIALDPSTGKLIEGGFEEQTRQTLSNLKAVIERAGYKLEDVVRCTVLLTDINNYTPMNRIYMEFFPSDPPARMAFAVRDLPMGALIEIDAIAVKK